MMRKLVSDSIEVVHRLPKAFWHRVITCECSDKVQPHTERDTHSF